MRYYPKCLHRPLIISIIVIIALFITAFAWCAVGDSCCKPTKRADSTPIVEIAPSADSAPSAEIAPQTPEIPQDSAKVADLVESTESLDLEAVKKDFMDNGAIPPHFAQSHKILFALDSASADNATMDAFHNATSAVLATSKLVIIAGHACDLGGKRYNDNLIARRINFTINYIKRQNPRIEILFSNEGQAQNSANLSEEERKMERRVDVYFYK